MMIAWAPTVAAVLLAGWSDADEIPRLSIATATSAYSDEVRAREAEMFGDGDDSVFDDVRAREAEMFGMPDGPAGAVSTASTASADLNADPARRRAVLPSDRRTSSDRGVLSKLVDRAAELDDALTIGGTLWLQLQATAFDEGAIEDSGLSSPNLVDVFLDSRPNDRLRGFVQGRLNYDPTGNQAAGVGFGGGGGDTTVQLDQLWLRFDVSRRVFVTAGKQRIRWGSGRLWNPTDFLNQQRLNPISLFDIRLGVPLIKLHAPVESLGWNFYVVANLDEADTIKRVGGALRAEILLGNAELSLSTALRQGDAQRFGIDLTAPIWDFDVRVELAVLHDSPIPRLAAFRPEALNALEEGILTPEEIAVAYVPAPEDRRGDWIPQVVAGAEIVIPYGDNDNVILGAEYFYNDAGYDDEAVYSRLLLAGQFNPLDVGRHYLGAFVSLVGPGSWDDTSLFLSSLANLSDLSGVVRADLSIQALTFLSFRVFGNVFWGTGAFSPRVSFDSRLVADGIPTLPVQTLLDRIPVNPGAQAQLPDLLAAGSTDGAFAGGLPLVQLGLALVVRL